MKPIIFAKFKSDDNLSDDQASIFYSLWTETFEKDKKIVFTIYLETELEDNEHNMSIIEDILDHQFEKIASLLILANIGEQIMQYKNDDKTMTKTSILRFVVFGEEENRKCYAAVSNIDIEDLEDIIMNGVNETLIECISERLGNYSLKLCENEKFNNMTIENTHRLYEETFSSEEYKESVLI